MRSSAARVVRYRSRTTFARQWGSYLSLVVLIGLIGGIAMGSIAAARRTQSAYPRVPCRHERVGPDDVYIWRHQQLIGEQLFAEVDRRDRTSARSKAGRELGGGTDHSI